MLTVEEIKKLILSGHTDLFYKDYYWRKLALEIIRENNFECLRCRIKGKYTRAKLVHHVLYLKDHPELAYSRTYSDEYGEHIQLMPLCHSCHEEIHHRGIFLQPKPKGFINAEKW